MKAISYTDKNATAERILSDVYNYDHVFIQGDGFYYRINAAITYDDFCANLERVDSKTLEKHRTEFGNVITFEYSIFRLIQALNYQKL